MKPPQTLRSRIVFYFCGYLAALLLVSSGALLAVFHFAQDLAFNSQLSEVANQIARHVEEHGEMPVQLPLHISAYLDEKDIPPRLRAPVKGHKPSVFEIEPDSLNYHAAIVGIQSTGQSLYVFYDVGSIKANKQFELFVAITLAGVGLGVLFLGWLLAQYLSNRVLNPVTELAKAVQNLSPDDGAAALRSFTTPDEVGALSEKIGQLLKRISEFTRREREFTSHASHELRTPLTVIKGAMEILQGRSDKHDASIQRPLARIKRAVTDIEMLIETFLLLARQEQHPDKAETCDLQTIAVNTVNSYRYLLEAKPVKVELRTDEAGPVQAPPSLVTIALGNLVRNAFQYTMKGKVEVVTAVGRVSVADSGPGIAASRKGAGLGLIIVERLCERMNWRFEIAGEPGHGTRAELIFISGEINKADSAPAPA